MSYLPGRPEKTRNPQTGHGDDSSLMILPNRAWRRNDGTEPRPLAARSRLQPQRCDTNNRPTARRSGCWIGRSYRRKPKYSEKAEQDDYNPSRTPLTPAIRYE